MNILKDARLRQYKKLSRYATFPYYYNTLDDKYQYGTTSYLKKDCQYENYKIKYGDSLDILALKFYNNPTYYWVIADFNNIIDPFLELPEGYYIKIPTISNIEFED